MEKSTRTSINAMSSEKNTSGKRFTIALTGNANVGKSAIFNQLTGLTQEVGNWSGKTVELRQGSLLHHGYQFEIIDLPGIYSFTAYSPEETITAEYILANRPDVIINVIDATSLERNLYFTLQMKEMGIPVILALNYADVAKKKHIYLDTDLLTRILGFPVISTIAIKGIGVHELIDKALDLIFNPSVNIGSELKYGPEIEKRIETLMAVLEGTETAYPLRWAAVQLLEGNKDVIAGQHRADDIFELAGRLAGQLESIHGENIIDIIAAERYSLAASISNQVHIKSETGRDVSSILDSITLHPVFGYFLFVLSMSLILVIISVFGGWLTEVITNLFESFNPHGSGVLADVFWNGAVVGFYASISVALGFILPFFIILGWLSESGYLPRIAFLMDRPCHTLGLHGQASLPLIMAFGCNVPACLACRVMDSRRDRIIATFLTTMVPCSARTSVVLGLVGAFVGWQWAVGLFILQFLIIFLIGKIMNKLQPNTSPGIIMEIPEYRMPSVKIVWRMAWLRFKDFVTIGVPLIVVGSIAIESLRVFNLLDIVTEWMSPVTVSWLGLPAFTGVLLIFGILRKEANLALLITFAGGAAITSIMTPLQMVVFSLVIMIYIPCISTIAVLIKETGVKTTIFMVLTEIGLAILLGGVAYRLLSLVF